MERSEPVCIVVANAVHEVFAEQCSLEDQAGSWCELEEFWGREKQRQQNKDGQAKAMSSSLEEQLLHEDFINEPKNTEGYDTDLKAVHGEEINDIPTSYMIGGFKPHELIVIGTYVDKSITPGFQYTVRKNPGSEHLFDGRALPLESVGLGYGKRITFRGASLNENDRYFWSDSRPHGFAFALQSLNRGDVMALLDTDTGRRVGRVVVTAVVTPDAVLDTRAAGAGKVAKRLGVNFLCDVVLSDPCNGQTVFLEEVEVKGVAEVVRERAGEVARVTEVAVEGFVVEGCKLVPEEMG